MLETYDYALFYLKIISKEHYCRHSNGNLIYYISIFKCKSNKSLKDCRQNIIKSARLCINLIAMKGVTKNWKLNRKK
jgi:hypothetical protein